MAPKIKFIKTSFLLICTVFFIQWASAQSADKTAQSMVRALKENHAVGGLMGLAVSIEGEEKMALGNADGQALDIALATTGEYLSPQQKFQAVIQFRGWFVSRRPLTTKKVADYLIRFRTINKATVEKWESALKKSDESTRSPCLILAGIAFQDFLFEGGNWKNGNPDRALLRLSSLTKDAVSEWKNAIGPMDEAYGAWSLIAVDELFIKDSFQIVVFDAAFPLAKKMLSNSPLNEQVQTNLNKQTGNKITPGQVLPLTPAEEQVLPPVPPEEAAKEIDQTMVMVQGGSFGMGTDKGYKFYSSKSDQEPVHTVELGNFMVNKYEVSQKQWLAIMGSNPSSHKNCNSCPVDNISWEDAQKFVVKLDQLTGKKYRLPTEAEWEYAARGGNKSMNFQYSGSDSFELVGWFTDSAYSRKITSWKHPVGQKAGNELGLYDMTGNVWEWCGDWYDPFYYSKSPSKNPRGPDSGRVRVLRGGAWYNAAQSRKVLFRHANRPDYPSPYYGLRLVRDL